MGIEKKIEKELPLLKKCIEKELDLSLGQIYVKPKKEFVIDSLEYIGEEPDEEKEEEIMNKINRKFWFYSTDLPNNIYYNKIGTEISSFLLGKEVIQGNLLHELAHSAHLKIVGKEALEKTPEMIVEGFAEYIRAKITREQFEEEVIPSDYPSYEIYKEKFENIVKERNLNSPEKLKTYLKSIHPF